MARCPRRNAIGILMGIELMLNAVNINLVAFWRYVTPALVTGPVFAIFVITVAAAESGGRPGADHRHLPQSRHGQRRGS